MHEIADMTKHIVEHAKAHESDTVPGDYATLETPCPKCGGVIKENYKKFQCQKCDFALWRISAGRQFEPAEIEELIQQAAVGPLQGFRSGWAGRSPPIIKLDAGVQGRVRFRPAAGRAATASRSISRARSRSAPVRSAAPRLRATACRTSARRRRADPRTCDFRSGKIILQRPIEPEQMQKLLATGKTDLLHRFISKKGRPFSAYLVRDASGKVSFEFAPRAAAKTPAKKTATRARKTAN